MSTPVTLTTTGRVTADLELKTSQNGKNTKFIQFGLAVNRGYGENSHPNFYKCILFGEAAQRMIDAKVSKGSLLQIVGDLELEEYQKHDGSTGWNAKVTLLSWAYAPTNKPKNDSAEEEPDFVPTEDCGENGLPFN